MRRGPLQSLAASPTMVGAVTVLIAIVAVFLAYNANNGLPFVPVYRVSVDVPNAARLTSNNEVRIGGHRVGVVESIEPVQDEGTGTTASSDAAAAGEAANDTGGVVAQINLKLDKTAEPLPKDSIFRVRYRSSFGLKYLEVIRGTGPAAPEGYEFDGTDDGGVCTLPADDEAAAEPTSEEGSASNGCFQEQTEFDEINDTFDAPTRENSRKNLVGFGDAFAGRGYSLSQAITNLRPLMVNLKPVSEALLEPSTQFRDFFPALGRTAEIVAPVAEEQAQLFTNMAATFAAISSDPEALKASITEGVPTLETGIETLPRQRPFLEDFTELSRLLRPGVADLRVTLPTLNEAITVGTPVLRRSVQMNHQLKGVFRQLLQLVQQPTTRTALLRLADTFDMAEPLARGVVPAQTVCNYWNYWFTSLPNGLSDRDQVGYDFRQALTNYPHGDTHLLTPFPPPLDNLTVPGDQKAPMAGYSGIQSNAQDHEGVFKPYELPITYAPIYGPHGERPAPPGREDCQAGQNGYPLGRALARGQDSNNPANAISDTPGTRGPTTLFWNNKVQRETRYTVNRHRTPLSWESLP